MDYFSKMFSKRHERRLMAKFTAMFNNPVLPSPLSTPGPATQPEGVMEVDLDPIELVHSTGPSSCQDDDSQDSGDEECYPGDVVFNDMVVDDSYSDEDEEEEEEDEIGEFLSGLRVWVVETSQSISAVDKLLRLMSNKLPNSKGIPRTHKTLMSTPKMDIPIRVCTPGLLAYFGIEKFMLTVTDESVLARDEVVITVGSDGAPLADSSARQMVPLLGHICDSIVPVFDIALYVGLKKPESACDYLREYAEEKVRLERDGVLVGPNKVLKKFRVKLFTADAPARAFVAGHRYFNHTKGCSKCDQTCISCNRRRIYSTTVGNLRDDQSFSDRTDYEHHNVKYVNVTKRKGQTPIVTPKPSLLEKSGHNMVTQFPIEPMHCLDQGVGKIILIALSLCLIFGGPQAHRALDELKRIFAGYHKYTPSEFARKTRSFEEIPRFKATEVRQFLLYTGLVLLKDFLSEEAYAHFLKLSMAYRLLSSSNTATEQNITVADELLNEFVVDFNKFYHKEFLRYNVHSLLHLAADVRLHGPLDSYSAYKFEDKIRQLKRMIKSNNRVPEQLFNRVMERRNLNYSPKIKKDKFVVRSVKFQRDSCFILKDRSVVEIIDICSSKTKYLVSKYQTVNSFFMDPFDSQEVGICLVDNLSMTEEYIDSSLLKFKCYRLPYRHSFVAIPIIHSQQ